jgi:hypothetical protein
MSRQLVEIDRETMYAKRVDEKRMRREAAALREFLTRLSPAEDKHGLRKMVLPVCEAALNGKLRVPMSMRESPVNISRIEDVGGTVPPEFAELYSRFMNTTTGSRADTDHPVEKDGKLWAWMEFED